MKKTLSYYAFQDEKNKQIKTKKISKFDYDFA